MAKETEKRHVHSADSPVESAVIKTKSRGKRNASSLISYLKTLGKTSLPIFLSILACNVGVQTVQRKA